MKRIHIGLQSKLVIAFLLISVIPLVIVMYFASRQGRRIDQEIMEIQNHHAKIITDLTSYTQQHNTMKEDVLLQNLITQLQESNQYVSGEFARNRQILFLVIIIVVTFVSSAVALILGKILTDPIIHLTEIAHKISQGELEQHAYVRARDEIGRLSEAFQSMTGYMKKMAHTANHIANGNIREMVQPKSPNDLLGNAFYTMEQYLNNIVDIAHRISNGNFVNTIELKSSEDVLGNAFRKMNTNLAETIRQINGEVRTIGTASETVAQRSEQDLKIVEDVLSSAEETSSSMMQMQASVEEVSGNMSSLSASIEETASAVEEMTMSMKQIANSSTGLSDSAGETFVIVQKIGETITRLVTTANQAESSSKEASESANAGQTSVREIIEGMKVIQGVVSTSAETIKVLGNRSEEIGSITDVISEIADQTSLLALNASIIAAQAGEHGRGFAVVAQEVKDLAHRSLVAAKEIGDLIKGVQAESNRAVQSMEEGLQAVENGVLLANRGGDALETILASIQKALEFIADNTRIAEEQAALSDQVREYMKHVLTVVEEITRAITDQQKGSAQVIEAVEQMRDLAEHVKRATTEQTRGTGHVLEAMENVTMRVKESSAQAHEMVKFSAELAKETATLAEILKQFHVGHQENALVPSNSQKMRKT